VLCTSTRSSSSCTIRRNSSHDVDAEHHRHHGRRDEQDLGGMLPGVSFVVNRQPPVGSYRMDATASNLAAATGGRESPKPADAAAVAPDVVQ
jgi:hypothetical protein